jgi:nucleotide-binding universal stress UspA family protein
MYKKILLTLDTTATDRAIIEHIKSVAKELHSELVLLHVADGWAARTFGAEAVSPEVTQDKAYLEKVKQEFTGAGIAADAHLAYGDPVDEIVRWTSEQHCDLVAMSTHGHRFWADLLFGTTASRVQHRVNVPVLLLKAS